MRAASISFVCLALAYAPTACGALLRHAWPTHLLALFCASFLYFDQSERQPH